VATEATAPAAGCDEADFDAHAAVVTEAPSSLGCSDWLPSSAVGSFELLDMRRFGGTGMRGGFVPPEGLRVIQAVSLEEVVDESVVSVHVVIFGWCAQVEGKCGVLLDISDAVMTSSALTRDAASPM